MPVSAPLTMPRVAVSRVKALAVFGVRKKVNAFGQLDER